MDVAQDRVRAVDGCLLAGKAAKAKDGGLSKAVAEATGLIRHPLHMRKPKGRRPGRVPNEAGRS